MSNEERREEQEMELEALTAIFMDDIEVESSECPYKYSIFMQPHEQEDDDQVNHVAIKLLISIPLDYPDGAAPELDVELVKGLNADQIDDILHVANEEAQTNLGMPSIYNICEVVRAWLVDNNVKGLEDGSMYAQMMRKAQEAERAKVKAQEFESQKIKVEMSEAERIELEVKKRREEGTPCTLENFNEWKEKFEQEMEEKRKSEQESPQDVKSKSNRDEMESRKTGYEIFTTQGYKDVSDSEEAAAVDGLENLDIDEELFDDDEDLDDLDFDSDEDDSEPEI